MDAPGRVLNLGAQSIVTGDCLEVLAGLEPASFDVCVTSPPYNIGIAYRTYRDRLPREVYLAWLGEVGAAIARVLAPEGSFFLNVGSSGADPWIATDVARAMGQGFVLQNQILWVKSFSDGDETLGHFKPINSPRFLNHNHEALYHFTKSGRVPIDRLAVGVPFKHKSNIARWGHAQDKRCAGDVWFIPYETVQSRAQKFHHPAGFPLELPLRCLRLHGVAAPRVLDPFLGAGTTLLAAQRLGGRGFGIEIDESYAAAAAARLAEDAGS
jgi:site-specific DNA-methyltransferase (adenine-specific)